MKCSLGLPSECVGCRARTVLRINEQPVCLNCAEHEPPAARVLKATGA
jgi:hypothetical protein